jgi:hypothetical protein
LDLRLRLYVVQVDESQVAVGIQPSAKEFFELCAERSRHASLAALRAWRQFEEAFALGPDKTDSTQDPTTQTQYG